MSIIKKKLKEEEKEVKEVNEKEKDTTLSFDREILHKEIDLIQACIKRMSSFSFTLRGWYVSIVTVALSILIGQKTDIILMGVMCFCITSILWGLDGFFLKNETLYRWKYDWIIKERINNNMDYLYDLNPRNSNMWLDKESKNPSIVKYIFSKTLIPLYGIMWLISVIMIIYGLIK